MSINDTWKIPSLEISWENWVAPNSASVIEFKKRKIQQILDWKHNYLDDTEPANYDAIFRDGTSHFLNIWNKIEKTGIGYIVFHDFLIKVAKNGGVFSSTRFTDAGERLFRRAIDDGLIEKDVGLSSHDMSVWKVIGDPAENLRIIERTLVN